jgi:hypothetical protein
MSFLNIIKIAICLGIWVSYMRMQFTDLTVSSHWIRKVYIQTIPNCSQRYEKIPLIIGLAFRYITYIMQLYE